NSGRLPIISATVSPRPTPRPASPRASALTRVRSSPHVSETSSSSVRTATTCGCAAAVRRSASPSVAASTAAGVVASRETVLSSICALLDSSTRLAGQLDDIAAAVGRSAAVLEAAQVVREADEEQHEHEREADGARALHHRERDRPAAQLL